ncbi:hypothetical protein [Pseudanabaena phage PA-SR01]|nr:hypothetical protein [Pseudanabaena phage PA-SR01]
MTTSLHHRQTAPRKFRDPYIIAQQLALLTQGQKSLLISNHAVKKHRKYSWHPDYVTKDNHTFNISRLDFFNIRLTPFTFFSALLVQASHENIFEIVLNTDYEVTKIALRTDLPTSPDTDIILVLAGEIEPARLEYQDVRLVTWYLNDKNDQHSTLQKERYAS